MGVGGQLILTLTGKVGNRGRGRAQWEALGRGGGGGQSERNPDFARPKSEVWQKSDFKSGGQLWGWEILINALMYFPTKSIPC